MARAAYVGEVSFVWQPPQDSILIPFCRVEGGVNAVAEYEIFEGGEVEISGAFPAGVIGATYDNLLAAAAGENHEHQHMYPEFAQVAEEEGFAEIACVMRNIAVAEAHHESRFLAFAETIKEGKVFKNPAKKVWRCMNCGFIHEGDSAPELCPACAHPQAYFQALA